MKVLGISAFYHDSAAAIIKDGRVLAAAQEERFSRIKHDASFPRMAVKHCLKQASALPGDIDAVVFYEDTKIKRDRQIQSFLGTAPAGFKAFRRFFHRAFIDNADPIRTITSELRKFGPFNGSVVSGLHHLSHAASAFYPSPFDEALIITVDGVGEWETTSISVGRGNRIERIESIHFPDSIGLLYSAFTSYCGFKVNDGEYKLMGLAPYGRPVFADVIRKSLLDLKDDGSFRLNLKHFDFLTSDRMYGEGFASLFDGPARRSEDGVTQRHMDVAASVQLVVEETLLNLVKYAVAKTGLRNLCLAGGVALNCVANGKILRSGLIDRIWVQPAAGDAGGALGCALQHYYASTGAPRAIDRGDSMLGSRLGPKFAPTAIEWVLQSEGAKFAVCTEAEIIDKTAQALANGDVVGWHDGAMEFGPRALGGRSILADPRRPDMQRTLNLKVKFRESFRPFAPIVLAEEATKWFEIEGESPYMLIVAPVRQEHRRPLTAEDESRTGFDRLNVVRSVIPAVTHVDYSARVQTVDAERSPRLFALLKAFHRLTGTPVLVNTSFNVNNEPIVCTPQDAYRCFMNTQIDKLVIGHCFLDRRDQLVRESAKARASTPVDTTAKKPDDSLYTLY